MLIKKNKVSKIIFEKKHFFGGLLNLLTICLLAFAGFYILSEKYLLSVFLGLIITFILLIFLNEKWFNIIVVYDEKIVIKYPLNIFGNKKIIFNYRDEVIKKVVYYGYMYRTPSHCKVICKKKTFRFNCSIDEAKELFAVFEANNIKVFYNNKNEVGYR